MNEHTRSPRSASFQRVVRDIWDLAELQWELLSVDSQVARRTLSKAMGCVLLAATLGGSALTVTLTSVGFLLAEMTQLSDGAALLATGGVAFAVVLTLGGVAWRFVASALEAVNDSRSEFMENLRWLKATLVSPESSPRNQLRSDTFSGEGSTRAPHAEHGNGNGRW